METERKKTPSELYAALARREYIDAFCHLPIAQDAGGLWSCNAPDCAHGFAFKHECEDACLAKYREEFGNPEDREPGDSCYDDGGTYERESMARIQAWR